MKTQLLVFASILLPACSSGDNTTDGGGSDSATDGTVIYDVAADTPPILDACVAVPDGAACDPANVVCGTKTCPVATQFCCDNDGGFTCDPIDGGGMGPPPPPPGGNCAGATQTFCDEAANCPNNQLCCGFVGAGGGYATTCEPACTGNAVQFCHGNAECGSGGPCVVQTCHGVTVQTCGGLTECPP